MSYTTKYTGTSIDKDVKALQDVQDYLGDKTDTLMEAVAWDSSIDSMGKLSFGLMMAGIEGYPVEAIARTFRPDLLQ